MLPITYFHIAIGFTYAQVYQDVYTGFIHAIILTYAGTYLGAIASFTISRYYLRGYVKSLIAKFAETSVWLSNFQTIEEIF